jgi:hypothetical protein
MTVTITIIAAASSCATVNVNWYGWTWNGILICHVKIGLRRDGNRNPLSRNSPAAMIAPEPGFRIIVLAQPYKKPQRGFSPRLK